MTTRPVIEVENLMRKFGDLTAVDGVTFHVNPGEVFGFLGPNGAGKTTAIGMLCTLLRPTSGLALVNGFDIRIPKFGTKNQARIHGATIYNYSTGAAISSATAIFCAR